MIGRRQLNRCGCGVIVAAAAVATAAVHMVWAGMAACGAAYLLRICAGTESEAQHSPGRLGNHTPDRTQQSN